MTGLGIDVHVPQLTVQLLTTPQDGALYFFTTLLYIAQNHVLDWYHVFMCECVVTCLCGKVLCVVLEHVI